MPDRNYGGLLLIGDPHLEGRQPGFRKDDYPAVILDKLAWCLDYAGHQQLLPVVLGDLFDKPRDNPNWMLVRLIELFAGEVIGLYGNHDCAEPVLGSNDSLSLLVTAGRLRLVSEESPWRGMMNGRGVVIGGSSYRCPIPKNFDRGPAQPEPLVIWLTHHDVLIPGYDGGRLKPFEIDGVDLVINGHIHRRLADVPAGKTLWINPGNISRRSRSDAAREHVPSVLRIDVGVGGYQREFVTVPHRPYDEVFHAWVADEQVGADESAFITGLADLQARRTSSGAGLLEFLELNLSQFQPDVAKEIRQLAQEVTIHGGQ